MPTEVDKVVCYVIRDGHLLVFTHDGVPLAKTGVQVPAGTIETGETAEHAAVRELFEQTGRTGMVVQALGRERYDLRPVRDEIAVRHFFLMALPEEDIAERWRAGGRFRSDDGGAVSWTCWWLPLEDAHVLAAGLGAQVGAAAASLTPPRSGKRHRPATA